jgi:hypothetical protein
MLDLGPDEEASSDLSDKTADATNTTPEHGRVFFVAVSRDWPGRPAYAICVEDHTGTIGDLELASMLEAPLADRVAALADEQPLALSAGCPFDYAGPPLAVRDRPSIFVAQIYLVEGDGPPDARIAEHWLPTGTDAAIPVTFVLRLPRATLDNRAALMDFLSVSLGPEPIRRAWKLNQE